MFDHSNSKDDWNYSIQLSRWFLKMIGAWPLILCKSTTEKLGCVILMMNSYFLISFLFVPCILSSILVDSDLDIKIKTIGPASFFVMAAVKHCILVSRGKNIGECLQHMRSDWDRVALAHKKDRETMLHSAKFGTWLGTISAGIMYSAGFFFTMLIPLCTTRTEIIDNQTVRLHLYPIYRGLFDPRDSPFFEMVLFIQILASYVIYTITVGVCNLAALIVVHACGQFQVLMLKMEDLVDGKERKSAGATAEGRLGDIVKSHIRILGFITCTEKLLQEIFLVEVVGSTFNMCFLIFNMLTVWEYRETLGTMTFCALFISVTFNIFLLCYIGELLDEQCRQIGAKSYMIDWYRLPGRGALSLTLIIAMSNSTIKLTAGKFMDLSLGSFCSIIKASMAYLNLLRTFNM